MKYDLALTAKAEALAKADYAAVAGKEIEVKWLTGYDSSDNSVDVSGPFTVTVDPTGQDLKHWIDEYLDPIWDVTPVGNHPALEGLRSFWAFGPSYRIVDGEVVPAQG